MNPNTDRGRSMADKRALVALFALAAGTAHAAAPYFASAANSQFTGPTPQAACDDWAGRAWSLAPGVVEQSGSVATCRTSDLARWVYLYASDGSQLTWTEYQASTAPAPTPAPTPAPSPAPTPAPSPAPTPAPAPASSISCGAACTVTTQHEVTVQLQAPPPMDLASEGITPGNIGLVLSWGLGVVLSMWALGYATGAGVTVIRKA